MIKNFFIPLLGLLFILVLFNVEANADDNTLNNNNSVVNMTIHNSGPPMLTTDNSLEAAMIAILDDEEAIQEVSLTVNNDPAKITLNNYNNNEAAVQKESNFAVNNVNSDGIIFSSKSAMNSNAVNNSNRPVSSEVAQTWNDNYNLDARMNNGSNIAGMNNAQNNSC